MPLVIRDNRGDFFIIKTRYKEDENEQGLSE